MNTNQRNICIKNLKIEDIVRIHYQNRLDVFWPIQN